MRSSCLLLLGLGLLGCTSHQPHTARLTARQASDLALRLANHKAQELYRIQPFRFTSPARLVDSRWVWRTRQWLETPDLWHARTGFGAADPIEAEVRFALDGSDPEVDVYFVHHAPEPLHLP